jgi:hypothetical protein
MKKNEKKHILYQRWCSIQVPHSSIAYESNIIDQRMNDNYNLDIFEITRTNEPTKELVKRKLLMLKHFQVDVKKIKCLL